MCFIINASLFIFYGLCIGVGVLATTACNRYAIYAIGEKVDQIQTDKGVAPSANSDPFQVGEESMILFYNAVCNAIEVHDFNKIKSLLEKIKHPTQEIFDDVVYLITGYKTDKKYDKRYPKRALLEQVITSYEGELSEAYTYTTELLNILFEIIDNYRFGLKQAFLQKHGDDKNTLIHLGVNTANLAIVECLVNWLKKAVRNNGAELIEICSMPNRLGITPLSMVAQAMYDAPLPCDGHIYDSESETHDYECLCDYGTEKRVAREEILLSLLELGVPLWKISKSYYCFIELLLLYYPYCYTDLYLISGYKWMYNFSEPSMHYYIGCYTTYCLYYIWW